MIVHKMPMPPQGPIPLVDVSRFRRKWLDLPYADASEAQRLDLYLPDAGEGPFPVVLHIHGGAFAMCDKREIQVEPYLRGLRRGYAVASANYRLSGEALFPAGLQDLKAAVRWLRANGARHHVDGSRIAACGGSAGGYYATMLGLTANVPALDDPNLGNPDFPCDVQAVVDWFGPTDFLKMDDQLAASGLGPCDHSLAGSPESLYMGARITDIPDRVRQANPLTYVHAGMPPILIQHGRLDSVVPVQQSIILAEEIEKRAGRDRFEFEMLDGAGHGDRLFETEANMDRVFAFLDKHLK
jgi:acetyl esterase/lipase